MKVAKNQPITGENMFRHESGIHTHGIIEYPYTYETFAPELVGNKRVLGRESGT